MNIKKPELLAGAGDWKMGGQYSAVPNQNLIFPLIAFARRNGRTAHIAFPGLTPNSLKSN